MSDLTRDANATACATPTPSRFPYFSALAAFASLFIFFALVHLVYNVPNPLDESRTEQRSAPTEKLDDVRLRNEALLNGTDPSVQMSTEQATAAILECAAKSKDAKTPHGRLPFPVEPRMP